MFCAIRVKMREQSPRERGNKEKLLPAPLADRLSASPFSRNKVFGQEPLKPVPTIRTELKKDKYFLETIILLSPSPTFS